MGFRNLPDMKPTNKPQFAGYGFQFDDGGASAPVQSVNGKTGAVVLDANDVGAPTSESVTASFNTVNGKIGDINDNIAPTEITDTASQAYTVGQYFINKDGNLCCVSADIASGGTIVLNTNCRQLTVGEMLSHLNGITSFNIKIENNKRLSFYTEWQMSGIITIVHNMLEARKAYLFYGGNTDTNGSQRASVHELYNGGSTDISVTVGNVLGKYKYIYIDNTFNHPVRVNIISFTGSTLTDSVTIENIE